MRNENAQLRHSSTFQIREFLTAAQVENIARSAIELTSKLQLWTLQFSFTFHEFIRAEKQKFSLGRIDENAMQTSWNMHMSGRDLRKTFCSCFLVASGKRLNVRDFLRSQTLRLVTAPRIFSSGSNSLKSNPVHLTSFYFRQGHLIWKGRQLTVSQINSRKITKLRDRIIHIEF